MPPITPPRTPPILPPPTPPDDSYATNGAHVRLGVFFNNLDFLRNGLGCH